jgi:cytochrome b pre-mRNA-processing protein 3
MLNRLFKPRPAAVAGRALYASAVAQARTPALYIDLAVPDTPEGRFELYSLHVYLLLERLKNQGPQAAEIAQATFDTYLSGLDNALRELGVGDTSVGKRMRKLGEAFYGRIQSYEKALAALPDAAPMEELIARTAYMGADATKAPALGAYMLGQRAALAALPLERFYVGEIEWAPA